MKYYSGRVVCWFIIIFSILIEGKASDFRERNIAIRQEQPLLDEYGKGDYWKGEAIPEIPVKGGVEVGELFIDRKNYQILRRANYIPMREEMSDEELLHSFTVSLREKYQDSLTELIEETHKKFLKIPLPTTWTSLFFSEKPEDILPKAKQSYKRWFNEKGELRSFDLITTHPPNRSMLEWAAAYRITKEDQWARAVVTLMEAFYKKVRPPLNRTRTGVSSTRHMWRTLNLGAYTPSYILAYQQISDWPELTVENKKHFLKSMIERGHYLKYTTTPSDPWLKYNPHGYANWILYQLEALLTIGAMLPEIEISSDWLDHARKGIQLHADWCFFPDSGHDELSYDYAFQVIGQHESCYMTMLRYGIAVTEEYRKSVQDLHKIALALDHPGGEKIPFGDAHPGASRITGAAFWYAMTFLDPRYKAKVTREYAPEHMLLFAKILEPQSPETYVERYKNLPIRSDFALTNILPESGWAILRTDWTPKANVLALAWKGAHVAHSGFEMLSFNLWSQGEPALVKMLGEKSYTTGFPKDYVKSPRVANLVIPKDARMRRVSGSLRNVYSSSDWGFFDMEHDGWNMGEYQMRRRVLFMKPSWVLLIDDVYNNKELKNQVQWQAHTGKTKPEIISDQVAEVRGENSVTRLFFGNSNVEFEELEIADVKGAAPRYLLKSMKEEEFPVQIVTLINIENSQRMDQSFTQPEWLEEKGYQGVKFSVNDLERVIWWDVPSVPEEDQFRSFLLVEDNNQVQFLSSDPNTDFTGEGIRRQYEVLKSEKLWNGRVYDRKTSQPVHEEELMYENMTLLGWSGLLKVTTIGEARRVEWDTSEKAIHSVMYREQGASNWRRQMQPGKHKKAWILLPDLKEGERYEMILVSEFENGRVGKTEVLFPRSGITVFE